MAGVGVLSVSVLLCSLFHKGRPDAASENCTAASGLYLASQQICYTRVSSEAHHFLAAESYALILQMAYQGAQPAYISKYC